MSTLSDRYVWGVLRSIPDRQRADLEPEIRALVADAVEAARARSGAGVTGPTDAASIERAALVELGDPEVLAARYTDRSLYLIGPATYLDYRRLLSLLLSIVVPVVTLATMGAGFIAQESAVPAVVNGLSAGFMVGIQLAFWVTLGFVVVERRGLRGVRPFKPWAPDDLPETPAPARMSAGDAIASIVGGLILLALIVWGAGFITSADGTFTVIPLFDPALSNSWAFWFAGVAIAQIAFAVIVYAMHRWTWPIAIVNAALGAAFVIPAVWLLQNGSLLGPEVRAQMEAIGAGSALPPTTAVISVVLVAAVGWGAISGLLKARRGSRGITL